MKYEPGESSTDLFGGNSNWRGPVWLPMNYLRIDSLSIVHRYYGNTLNVSCPAGSERRGDLGQVPADLSERLISLFRRDPVGRRPVHGQNRLYMDDPHFRDLILFYEYFHGDTEYGIGASHQTGWTGLIAEIISIFGQETIRTTSIQANMSINKNKSK